ncbi:MAG: peptidylprolyl isomerase [Candidatus Polarisedimenticolia bacterium]
MLQQMRESFRYLKWVLLLIVVMFVWWAFASWGGGAAPGRAQDAWAARVNGTVIAVQTFQGYARRLDSTYQGMFGEQYAQQRAFIRVGQQAINTLIEQELLYQEALRQGIAATPREVAMAITRDPGLQENGRFIGVERYRNLFGGAPGGIEAFEGEVRRDLVVDKFRALLQDTVAPGEAEIEEEFLRRSARSTVSWLVADPARVVPDGAVDDAALARHYEAHRERYSRGEGRLGVYVLFSPQEMQPVQPVTDAEIEAAYQRQRDTRYSQPEQRRASHVLFKVPADAAAEVVARAERKARDVARRARAGEDFAALARSRSEDSSAAQGGDLNFFGRGQMVPEFETTAFSLPVGGISGPIRSSFGFHVIKVTDARESRTVPLEEAREALRNELRLARGREEMLRRGSEFAAAAREGGLETVARSQGLVVRETGPVRQGEALPALAASQPVTARMMELKQGEVSEPIPTPSGQVVVQVTGVAPDDPLPFETVKDRVRDDLLKERALEVVAEAFRDGDRPEAVARRLKTEVRTQADLARGAPLPGLPANPEIARQIATLPPGVPGAPVATDAGIVVLVVKARDEKRDELPAQKDAIRDALVRQRQDRFYRAFLKRLREGARVEVNDAVVETIDRT